MKNLTPPWQRACWLMIAATWIAGVVGGFTLLAQHDNAAGAAGSTPPRWPGESRIPWNDQGHTLVMFAHPRCPCTRSSFGELERIVSRCPNAVKPWVVFFKPSGTEDAWHQTGQWFYACDRLGFQVLCDVDGAEARRFGAMTSGHTVLYGPNGDLLFSGGITMARAHAGDNQGRSAIEAILSSSTPAIRRTPVFGCPIIVSQQRQ